MKKKKKTSDQTSAAGLTEVGVTLAHGQEARTLLRVALALAPTPGEPVLTFTARRSH